MDILLRTSWLPYFQKYTDTPEPSVDEFMAYFSEFIPRYSMAVADIKGSELKEVAKRMSGGPGMDGWRVAELKALPDVIFEMLAQVFNVIEKSAQWPTAVRAAHITLIDKGVGAKPLDLRPVTVMSAAYRLWAARRLQDIKGWQEKWIAGGLHGFRAGHCVQDVFWKLALEVEASYLSGQPVF
eukprot:3414417-Karenia_brevis.AAC.1